MDTRQLAAFVAVVDKKSFSQAAERLGVTQPAVSLQIAALEKRLGVRLLDRSGRGVEPTEAGQRLYRNAHRVLAAEEQLLDEVSEEEALSGRFELGASTGPGGSVVPILLGKLARTYPDVSVALTVADTHRIVELVAERALELGVVGFPRRLRAAPPGGPVRAALPRPGRSRVSSGTPLRRHHGLAGRLARRDADPHAGG